MFGGGVSEAGMDAPSFELFNLETDLCCGRLSSCRRRSLFLCCASLFCSKPFLIAFSIVSFSSPKTCAQHSIRVSMHANPLALYDGSPCFAFLGIDPVHVKRPTWPNNLRRFSFTNSISEIRVAFSIFPFKPSSNPAMDFRNPSSSCFSAS
uniref:(northern house mosquito) hypothetical protein n=1 Tax=Culex pipiens TaxID=7175 RepID=A0A8D8MKB0_CULPI